jgi:hypothetical protein
MRLSRCGNGDDAGTLKRAVTWMDNSNAAKPIRSCRPYRFNLTDPNRCASVNVRGSCRWVTNTVTTINDEANDGIVTRSSAIAMPGAIPLTEEQMKMPGSQHMQMRNDPNLKLKLTALFKGELHTFFTTD